MEIYKFRNLRITFFFDSPMLVSNKGDGESK